jgi:23S rRNA (uridine2552-2'-O)-methyltransferase
MARTKSSARWLKEHFDDPYVKKAQKEGYRGRAAYKLLEINKKYKILKPGQTVVDLGAAPGSWSQVTHTLIGSKGKIIALDLLPMDSLPGTLIITGDFSSDDVYQQLLTTLNNEQVDVVLSDIAPNMSGIKSVDQPKGMYLLELVLEFTLKTLKKGGHLVTKGFQGAGFDVFAKDLRAHFTHVYFVKPEASRGRSAEIYLICLALK